MRWLLVGEDPSEHGSADHCDFLRELVAQLASTDCVPLAGHTGGPPRKPVTVPEFVVRTCAELASTVPLPLLWPKGMARVSARAVRAARALNCDAVVVLVDNDHHGLARRRELASGFSEATVSYAGGVAKETLEAWIIADAELLAPMRIRLSKSPEDLWGNRHNPDSEHPKHVLRRALEEARGDYRDVLQGWSVERAVRRAPWLREFCASIVRILPYPDPFLPEPWDEDPASDG